MPTDRNRFISIAIAEQASIKRRLLGRRVGDSALVDDFMQDMFVRLLEVDLPDEKSIGSIPAYVTRIAINVANDWTRVDLRRKAAYEFLNVLDPHSYGPLDSALQTRQELKILYRAFRSLPRRIRRVVLLRKIGGLSQREIATRLGIAEHTVETYVGEAMDHIEQKLVLELDREQRNTVLGWLRRRTSND